MIRAIVHQGLIGPAIEYFATIAGPDVDRRFFFEQISALRNVVRYFGGNSEIVINPEGVRFRGNGGIFGEYMFGGHLPDILHTDRIGTAEVADLLNALRAVADPADDLAVVAALRSSLYACGDDDLVRWRQAGGRWDYTRPAPPGAGGARSVLFKWIALYAPLPWPRGVKTRPEVDQEQGGTPPAEFAGDVVALVAACDRFMGDRERAARSPPRPPCLPCIDAPRTASPGVRSP